MKQQETAISALAQFLPPNTYKQVAPFFQTHAIHLRLTHERKSVLGDYRTPTREKPYHRISVNANLNPYSFLITLLHELAHLLTWVHFKNKAAPHGKEWKTQFRHVLIPFLGQGIFPPDVEAALLRYVHNPAASTCTDPALFKALRRYDEPKPGYKLVEELKPGQWFSTDDGRVYEKLEALRTRSRCRELKSGRVYLFPGIVEVRTVRRQAS